jgi:hypothetical protein
MKPCALAAAVALLLSACEKSPEAPPAQEQTRRTAPSASPYPQEFWSTWNDGLAEVSAYELTYPDGRRGTAVLVFALEQWSAGQRTEAGNGYGGSDTVSTLRMTAHRQRAPGIGETLSVAAALEPVGGEVAGHTVKVLYAGRDWSGPVSWHGLGPAGEGHAVRSYPDPQGVPDDALPLCARRIAWPVLRLGQSGVFASRPSLRQPVGVTDRTVLRLTLSAERQTTVVPAGSFRTHRFTAEGQGSGPVSRRWEVETEPPHRIVRWDASDGETGVLLGSGRWKLEEAADPRLLNGMLRSLGLPAL